MSEQRNIEVRQENNIWTEYDREVAVELYHNRNQSTTLRLSREEALDLSVKLSNLLYWLERDEQEAEENDS